MSDHLRVPVQQYDNMFLDRNVEVLARNGPPEIFPTDHSLSSPVRYDDKLIRTISAFIYGPIIDVNGWENCAHIQFWTTAPDGTLEFGLRAADIYTPEKKSVVGALGDAEKAGLVDAGKAISFGGKEKISHRNEIITLSPDGMEIVTEWERQVSGRTSHSPPRDLTLAAVAFHAAKTVYECVEKQHNGSLTVANGTVVVYEDLILLELVQVTENSYQIVLAYHF